MANLGTNYEIPDNDKIGFGCGLWTLSVPFVLCQADLMSMVTGSIALMSCSMITNTGPQRAGEDGLQSGHLQQHDHRLRETRHQGLHLDDAQG